MRPVSSPSSGYETYSMTRSIVKNWAERRATSQEKRLDALSHVFVAYRPVMKRLISCHRDQLVRISADKLPAKYRVVTPFGRTVDVEYCQRLRIRQRRHFERLDRPIGAFEVVV